MKIFTLKKRFEKLSVLKSSKSYRIVKDLIEGTDKTHAVSNDNIIRPCSTSGRGRFCTNLDYTSDVENLLLLLGIKFYTGNDSPRGG